MKHPSLHAKGLLRRLLLSLFLSLSASSGHLSAQAPSTGAIEGRVTNPATGLVVERARIAIEGTTLEAFSGTDGYYRLEAVPVGAARVRATFSGFPAASATVEVAAGKVAQGDFQLSPRGAAAEGATVRLDEFVVATSREMSGAALAISHCAITFGSTLAP